MNAPVTPIRTEAENALAAAFGAARLGLAGGGAVAQRRDEALATFMRSGLPHRRVEAWHYTDLRAALREVLALAEPPSAATIEDMRRSLDARVPRLFAAESVRLVMVDGVYVPDLSDSAKIPAGVVVRTLADALAKGDAPALAALPEGALGSDDAALALNAAFMNGGLVLDVAAGTRVDRPLELVSIASAVPAAIFLCAFTGAARQRRYPDADRNACRGRRHGGPEERCTHFRSGRAGRDRACGDVFFYRCRCDPCLDAVGAARRAGAAQLFRARQRGGTVAAAGIFALRGRSCQGFALPASTCCGAASTPIRRSSSIMSRRTAKAANISNISSTARRPACSRARSSSRPARRRPTA